MTPLLLLLLLPPTPQTTSLDCSSLSQLLLLLLLLLLLCLFTAQRLRAFGACKRVFHLATPHALYIYINIFFSESWRLLRKQPSQAGSAPRELGCCHKIKLLFSFRAHNFRVFLTVVFPLYFALLLAPISTSLFLITFFALTFALLIDFLVTINADKSQKSLA